jgi:hypothetical protein
MVDHDETDRRPARDSRGATPRDVWDWPALTAFAHAFADGLAAEWRSRALDPDGCAQKALVALWDKAGPDDPNAAIKSPKAWLRRTVRDLLIDSLRARDLLGDKALDDAVRERGGVPFPPAVRVPPGTVVSVAVGAGGQSVADMAAFAVATLVPFGTEFEGPGDVPAVEPEGGRHSAAAMPMVAMAQLGSMPVAAPPCPATCCPTCEPGTACICAGIMSDDPTDPAPTPGEPNKPGGGEKGNPPGLPEGITMSPDGGSPPVPVVPPAPKPPVQQPEYGLETEEPPAPDRPADRPRAPVPPANPCDVLEQELRRDVRLLADLESNLFLLQIRLQLALDAPEGGFGMSQGCRSIATSIRTRRPACGMRGRSAHVARLTSSARIRRS